jgi:nitrite reductase (NADH) large subunit
VLAIGECALWDNKIYGLVAPGYQMARAAATLAGEDACFSGADMSTKLKLLGVDVASFGDAQGRTPGCQSYQWTDGPQQIYKKSSSVRTAKPCSAACWWGCQRLRHAAADDAERHGAAAAPGKPDPAGAGGSAPKALGRRRCRTARRSAPAITSAKAISARR